jgi:hypothetical protein
MPRVLLILMGQTAALFLWLSYLNHVTLPPLASGQSLLDLRPFGYSVQTALDWAAGLSDQGRALYLGIIAFSDAVFMVLLTIFLAWLAIWLTPKWTVVRIGIIIFAVIYLYGDVQEGYLIRQLVNADGGQGADAYAAIASLSTMIKFAALAVAGIWLTGLWWTQRKLT